MVEWSGLWLRPETRVVVLGGTLEVGALLHHFTLRNTIHALYLALHNHTLHKLTPTTRLREESSEDGRISQQQFTVIDTCRNNAAANSVFHL